MTPEHRFTDKRRSALPEQPTESSTRPSAATVSDMAATPEVENDDDLIDSAIGSALEAASFGSPAEPAPKPSRAQKKAEKASAKAAQAAAPTGPAVPEGEQYLRLMADFENYRRRTAQQILDQQRYSSEAAARALLPVLDNLERGLEHAPENDEAQSFVEGVRMAARDFTAILEQLGVKPIEAVGTKFDPALHEAIGGEETNEYDVDTVTTELQRGWLLHDRVLRPAIVRIATPVTSE